MCNMSKVHLNSLTFSVQTLYLLQVESLCLSSLALSHSTFLMLLMVLQVYRLQVTMLLPSHAPMKMDTVIAIMKLNVLVYEVQMQPVVPSPIIHLVR